MYSLIGRAAGFRCVRRLAIMALGLLSVIAVLPFIPLGAGTPQVGQPPDPAAERQLRYCVSFDARDYQIASLADAIDQLQVAEVLEKARREQDWFSIGRVATEFPDTDAGKTAEELIDKRLEPFRRHFCIRSDGATVTIPSGGLAFVGGHLNGDFMPGVSYGLSLFQAHLPMELTALQLSFDLDAESYEVVVIVDPEAVPGNRFSCEVIPCVTPVTGRPCRTGLEFEVTIAQGPTFDAVTVMDIYLAASQSRRRAEALTERVWSALDSVGKRLSAGETYAVHSLQSDLRSIQSNTKKQIALTNIYVELLRRAVLHRDASVSDAAKGCLVTFLGRRAGQVTVSVCVRGYVPTARQSIPSETEDAATSLLPKLLAVALQADAWLEQLPDEGVLQGAIGETVAAVLAEDDGERRLKDFFAEHPEGGTRAISALNALRRPGARLVLAYIDEQYLLSTRNTVKE